nr:hypothetical protein [Brevundimonas sp.]
MSVTVIELFGGKVPTETPVANAETLTFVGQLAPPVEVQTGGGGTLQSRPAPGVSLSTAPLAALGPALVAVIVQVINSPERTVARSATLVTRTSAT